jgi:hypothetical protein
MLSMRYSRRGRRPDARGSAGGGGAGAGPRDAGQDPRQPGLDAGATTWWPSPLAAGAALPGAGLALSPSATGALMAFSSLAVVGNSLLLRGQARPAACSH